MAADTGNGAPASSVTHGNGLRNRLRRAVFSSSCLSQVSADPSGMPSDFSFKPSPSRRRAKAHHGEKASGCKRHRVPLTRDGPGRRRRTLKRDSHFHPAASLESDTRIWETCGGMNGNGIAKCSGHEPSFQLCGCRGGLSLMKPGWPRGSSESGGRRRSGFLARTETRTQTFPGTSCS